MNPGAFNPASWLHRLPAVDPWSWVLALHAVFAVLWVGGMFFALVVLRLSIAPLDPPQRIAVHNRAFRRFFVVVWHAIAILLLSGYAMAVFRYGGMAHLPWNVDVMQAIAWIMTIVFVVIVFGPYRRFRAAASNARAAAAAERIRRLILLNLILGIIVVVVAALG